MRIDHGGPDIGVAQKRLDRSDVVTRLQQMSGVGMPEGMRGDALGELRFSDREIESVLSMRIMQMIPPPLLRFSDEGQRILR